MDRIIVEVEPEFQPLVDAFHKTLAQVRTARETAGRSGPLDYAEVEVALAACTAGLECAAHQVVLEALEIDAPGILVDGQPYRRVLQKEPGTYYTMAGPAQIERTLYRRQGERGGAAVDAVSLRAGVVGAGWLPRTAQVMAYECQRAPSREAEQASGQWLRLPYSRCSFEDVAHLVGEQYASRRHSVERALIEETLVPAAAHSVSVSLDRISVPMEEPRPRKPGRPKKKAPKRPVQRVYRMAWAATVTLHDAEGKALLTLRYGRMPKDCIENLVLAMADDVATWLRVRPDLLVELLCDGGADLWKLLAEEFNEASLGHPVFRLVDFWHLCEKLGKAAQVLCGKDGAEAQLRRWRIGLLNDSNTLDGILQTLRASGKDAVRVGDSRPVHEAITYLENHRADMNYAEARRQGLPIGSGNVEATCKSLFEVRLKRSGCRWKDKTGGHIVDLRALALSDRWDRALRLTLAPLRHHVMPTAARSRRARRACAG